MFNSKHLAKKTPAKSPIILPILPLAILLIMSSFLIGNIMRMKGTIIGIMSKQLFTIRTDRVECHVLKEEQDVQDRKRQDMQDANKLPLGCLTESILRCCFEVINSLGSGYLESVYKNALIVAMTDLGLNVRTNKGFEVTFRNRKIGLFIPDIIVQDCVIVELKCCEHLLPEHQAQLINYLKVTDIHVGLLVNFGRRKLQYKRSYHPAYPAACDHAHPVLSSNW